MKCKRSLLSLLTIIGLAGCHGDLATSLEHPGSAPSASSIAVGELGSHLPQFDVKDLQGREVSSKDLRGKVVLVDIWATWCQPCRKEMPGYQKLLDRYGARGFVVIGFKSNMMMDTVEPLQFAKSIEVHYPLVSASSEVIGKFCELEGLPTTLIYDRKGLLRKKVIGFDDLENFDLAVKTLL